jgi:hypothetical protein
MLYEWKISSRRRNLGDALGKLFVQPAWRTDKEHVYFPIGSVIVDGVMRLVLDAGYTPVFVACGWRGEKLSPELVHRSMFFGVRGPDTQEELARHDVDVEVILDPGYEVPMFIEPGARNNETLLIPHILDIMGDGESYKELGVDHVVQPVVENDDETVDLVKRISGADFVLGGAMHACILAHAYGVPFSPFAQGYVDCPPKWQDWMKSVGITSTERFPSNLDEGKRWYAEHVA